MNMDLVSIVMPCHNGSQYIEKAIDSVIQQTYTNWELLIINDFSTDNSAEIINKYVMIDNRIKFFNVETSVGNPSEPRNIGIKNALGRYIAFLDCDDIWINTKLERQIPLFDGDDIYVVFSWYEKIDEQGKRHNRIIKSRKEVDYKTLLKSDIIGNLTGVYDTKKVGKMYQINQHMEDYIMWLSILKKGGIAKNTSTVEALYRISNKSLSASKFTHISWQWNVYRKIEKLSLLKSLYYYSFYAMKGFIKFLK